MYTPTPDETILGLLLHRPRHGYDLLSCFEEAQQLGKVWNLSTSQVYAVLNRLREQNLIVGREIVSESAPPRTVYVVTEAGEQRFQEWLNATPSPSIRQVRVLFLSRLHVAALLGLPLAPIVARQAAACRKQRDALNESLRALETQRPEDTPPTGLLALQLVQTQLDAVLAWVDACAVAYDAAPQTARDAP